MFKTNDLAENTMLSLMSVMMRNHAQSLVEDESGQQNDGFLWNMNNGNPDFGGLLLLPWVAKKNVYSRFFWETNFPGSDCSEIWRASGASINWWYKKYIKKYFVFVIWQRFFGRDLPDFLFGFRSWRTVSTARALRSQPPKATSFCLKETKTQMWHFESCADEENINPQ